MAVEVPPNSGLDVYVYIYKYVGDMRWFIGFNYHIKCGEDGWMDGSIDR